MSRKLLGAVVWIVSLLSASGLAVEDGFLTEVESLLRDIAENDEALSDPTEFRRLKTAMSDGRDWEGALIRLIDPENREQRVIQMAISALGVHGSLGSQKAEAVLIPYFNSRVKAAREHDRTDVLFDPVIRVGVRSLASRFAEDGGPGVLLAVLNFANSAEERVDPLLDKYSIHSITKSLLEKGDSRHLDGMRKLMARIKDMTVRANLELAIAKAEAIQSAASANAPNPPAAMESPSLPVAVPSAMAADGKVADASSAQAKRRTLMWIWGIGGILAIVAIIVVALRRRR